jgi:hypothetical protein
MQTERVTFLTSPEQKAALDAFAAQRGESVGNVVREATAKYISRAVDEEEQLAALVAELAAAVPEMRASLRRSAKKLEDAGREVDVMLRKAGVRK